MLNVNALKSEMVKYGYTQKSLSSELGMSERTFSNRLKSGNFGLKEVEIMIKILHLNHPMDIFFA